MIEYEQHIILHNCYNHYYSCFKIFRDSLGKMGLFRNVIKSATKYFQVGSIDYCNKSDSLLIPLILNEIIFFLYRIKKDI